MAVQDFMKATQCAMYEFTDLGWWELDATGANTRICFIRCDTADCVQKQVSSDRNPPLGLP